MKKGFTLVELLAVIIILAVISTIVVPIVLNIVNDSKKSTYESSIELYGKAVKQAILNYELDKKATPTSFDQIKPYLEFEGNSVECNIKIVYEDGEIYLKDCSVDGNLVEDYTYGKPTLSDTILKHATDNKYYYTTKPDFTKNTVDGEYGLYKAEDDYGMSYYFRGDVENNYVQFGEWQVDTEPMAIGVDDNGVEQTSVMPMSTCEYFLTEEPSVVPFTKCKEYYVGKKEDSMYWRIIRINGDGTIRLIYDGTKAERNDSIHGNYIFFDPSSSMVEYTINQFYNDNLKIKYSKYMSDSIFCEEKVIVSEDEYWYHLTNIDRINNNNPKLTCTRDEDKLTVARGNLIAPIGYITADEALMGGKAGNNSYLKGEFLKTYTYSRLDKEVMDGPRLCVHDNQIGEAIALGGPGGNSIRPVINLKADVRFTGTGTMDDPYEIMTD